MLKVLLIMGIGSFIMLGGIVLGWAMSETTRKRTKIDVHVYDTRGTKIVEKETEGIQ